MRLSSTRINPESFAFECLRQARLGRGEDLYFGLTLELDVLSWRIIITATNTNEESAEIILSGSSVVNRSGGGRDPQHWIKVECNPSIDYFVLHYDQTLTEFVCEVLDDFDLAVEALIPDNWSVL